MDEVHQTAIVGIEAIPRARRRGRRGEFEYLRETAKQLKDGMAIRLIIPKRKYKTAYTAWSKIAKELGRKPHTAQMPNGDETIKMFLWFKPVRTNKEE